MRRRRHRPVPTRESGPEPISVRIPDAVRMTGISRSRIYELIRDGRIEIVKRGSATLIPAESLRQPALQCQPSLQARDLDFIWNKRSKYTWLKFGDRSGDSRHRNRRPASAVSNRECGSRGNEHRQSRPAAMTGASD